MSTTYTLPDVILPDGGTLHTELISSVGGLTAPTFPCLLLKGGVEHRVDVLAGAVDNPQAEFGFIEDYSVHSAGFWYTIMNGTALDIWCTIDEGAGAKPFFYGTVNPQLCTIDEVDLTSGAITRQSDSFKADSGLAKLKSYPVSIWAPGLPSTGDRYIDEAVPATGPWGGTYGVMQTPHCIVCSFMKALNGSFDWSDCIEPLDGTGQYGDIQYTLTLADPTNIYNFATTYILVDVYGGPATKPVSVTWAEQFSNLYDVLMALCRSWGYFPYYYFDGSRHRVQMMTRGRSVAAATLPTPLAPPIGQSKFYPMAVGIVQNQTLTMPTGIRGTAPNQYGSGFMTRQTWNQLPTPSAFASDLDTLMLNGLYLGPIPANPAGDTYTDHYEEMLWQLHDKDLGTGYYQADFFQRVQYWDYATGAYSSLEESALQAMGEYLFYRLGNYVQKRGYDRTYPGIAATVSGVTSQKNVTIAMQHDINDGVSTRHFWASDVTKDPMQSLTKIHWVEI